MSAAFDLNRQQRRVPRRAYAGAVGVLAGGGYEMERARSLGEGGLMITTSRALAPGDQIVVNFNVENSAEFVIVRATVRSFIPPKTTPQGREPAYVGIEFTNLGFAHRRVIRNFVARATESMI